MEEYTGFKNDTEPGYEEWKTLVDDTRRNVKGLKLQLAVTEGILENAKHQEKLLRPTKPKEKTPKTPDNATDDVKTHANQTAS